MRMPVKDMDIATGGVSIVILNRSDASRMDLRANDRLLITKGNRKATAILDIAESMKAVPPGRIGLFEEVLDALHAKQGDTVDFHVGHIPKSVLAIKQKLDGKELTPDQITSIIDDIVNNNLTDVELTSYITANYTQGMCMHEIIALTKAMTKNGTQLHFKKKPVMDIHSIGGVPGNRTTPIIVAIVAAAGLIIPKTSSRAITSPAGTADTLEVLTNVVLTKQKLESMIRTIGGFMVWGGAISLAPADDKIIAVEHPLNIDAEGQMLASIMAKKSSVGTTKLLLEIPLDKNGKVHNKHDGQHLRKQFVTLGKHLGIEVHVLFTQSSQPVGNGIGPALEARDLIWVLTDDRRGPTDLRDKSLLMAGKMLEMGGKARKGEGGKLAQHILDSGLAYKKFAQMIRAQGGPRIVNADKVPISPLTSDILAWKTGRITDMDNHHIAQIAKDAGAPSDKGSGIYLRAHLHWKVNKGDVLYTIHAHNRDELAYAVETSKKNPGITIT